MMNKTAQISVNESFHIKEEATKDKIKAKISIKRLMDKVDITMFKKHINYLTKEQISAFLENSNNKLKKKELVEVAAEKIYGNELLMIKFYNEFMDVFAVTPVEVEQILGCTKAERKRWTEDGLLEVLEYRTFSDYGKKLEYPVFDRLQLYSIKQETIDGWRKGHEETKKKNKAVAVKKAMETRKINDNKRADFKKDFKKVLASWYKLDSKLGATFELAYWTVWISRWAKENQEKAYVNIRNKEVYIGQKDYLYNLKNTAIGLLTKSEYASQSFYRPENHSKETFELCQDHYNDWKEEREGICMSKWTYFGKYKEDIQNCPYCNYDTGKDYYSLFCLEIKHEEIKDYKFSFHTPYNLGVSIFRDKDQLTQVQHSENGEGMFRFGRSLFEEEKVIYREKEVIKKFEEAMGKFKLYY